MAERIEYTQWLKRGTSTFIPTDNAKTVSEIEAGVYNLRWNRSSGFYLFKKDLKLDELTNLDSEELKEVIDSIKVFWTKKDKFKEYGFTYKRGILMYGPPGSGKTSVINLLAKYLMEDMNGVVFILQSAGDLDLYRENIAEVYRLIEPDRPIITVIEDIDGLCNRMETETTLINILDGIEQLENVVYIATTNYLEKLSERITNRPNRFDRRIHIGFPNAKARRSYFKFKLKPDDLARININDWVKKTAGFTIAHLGELIKSVVILENNLEDTIKILKSLKNKPSSYDYNKSNDEDSSIGFSKKTPRDEDEGVEMLEAADNENYDEGPSMPKSSSEF